MSRAKDILRNAPLLTALFITLSTAYLLGPETTFGVINVNDNALHLTVARGMVDAVEHGQNPLDFWTPEIGLGQPIVRLYQPLGHAMVAATYFLLFKSVSLATIFAWFRFLLMALTPLTFYACARLIRLDPWTSVAAALLAPLVSGDKFGIDYGSYTWEGWGLYPQLVATHFLLLGIGFSWRAIRERGNFLLPGLLLACAGLSNLLYGYFGALTVVLIALMPCADAAFRMRVTRLVKIGGVGLLIALPKLTAWYVDAALMTRGGGGPGLPKEMFDSFGAAEVLRRLISGEILDTGRPEILTVLAMVGIVLALVRVRSYVAAPFLLTGFAFFLLLFFGPATWGSALRFIGVVHAMQMHRTVGIVEVFLVFLAAIPLAALWRVTVKYGSVATALVVTVLLLGLPVRERFNYLNGNEVRGYSFYSTYQDQLDDIEKIMSIARERGGRVYAPKSAAYGIDEVPFLRLLSVNRLPNIRPIYISFGLGADFASLFDEMNPEHYKLFNIRTVILLAGSTFSSETRFPSGAAVPAFLKVHEKIGHFVVYDAPGEGYFAVKHALPPMAVNRDTFYPVSLEWFKGPRDAEQVFDLPGLPTPFWRPNDGGTVRSEAQDAQGYSAVVESGGPAVVLFRMNFHPHWHARVDGKEAPVDLMAPGYMGIPVTGGRHEVRMEYRAGLL